MGRTQVVGRALVFVAASLIAVTALAQALSPEEYVRSIEAIKDPEFDSALYSSEKDSYYPQYLAAVKQANTERNALIFDFYTLYPKDARLPELMERRWMAMMSDGDEHVKIAEEIDAVAARVQSDEMTEAADYCRIIVLMRAGPEVGYDTTTAVLEYREKNRESPRLSGMIQMAIQRMPVQSRKRLLEVFLADYPDHDWVKYFRGQLRQIAAFDKPFELKFNDASTGRKIDIKDLRGKVVMIDWWATWCGPCIEELPHIKELYKKYHDLGFEIIGVSLDQPVEKGGLTKLQEYVKENDMPWPQYYMGNYWDSEFSVSWGIFSIPNLFLIDKEGNLVETEVKDLEKSIKRLLSN